MSSQAGVSACSSPTLWGNSEGHGGSSMAARFLIPASGTSGAKGLVLMSAELWDQLRRQVEIKEGAPLREEIKMWAGRLWGGTAHLSSSYHSQRLIKCCILSPCRFKLDICCYGRGRTSWLARRPLSWSNGSWNFDSTHWWAQHRRLCIG